MKSGKKQTANDGWCYMCGREGYETHEVKAYASYDEMGNPIKAGPMYMHIEAFCPECESLVFVERIHNENIERRRQSEREFYGLVSHADLLKLPKKYGVPRGRIDEILNLESNLFLRHEGVVGVSLWDGEVPSKDESDRIKKALDSPEYFLKRMDAIKNELPTEFYERVRGRILKMVKHCE